MKKEQVTQFDLESAFKALDEIEIPKVMGGIKPNRINLHEATKRVDRLSLLVEDYYNLREETDLQDAANDREYEIAKAKLARIEKIVDLDAESEDDILPSYVGKIIIQCPQCMTLFYKKPEDVIPSDEDPDTVNVGEECQHCGDNDGYMLIGKVAAAESTDLGNENTEDTEMSDEGTGEELPDDLSGDEGMGETTDEGGEEDLNVNLDDMTSSDVAEEGTEDTELKEAAFQRFLKSKMLNETITNEENKILWDIGTMDGDYIGQVYAENETAAYELAEFLWPEFGQDITVTGEATEIDRQRIIDTPEKFAHRKLGEALDAELDKKLSEHSAFIDYIRNELNSAEKELANAKNEEIKNIIKSKIDTLTQQLEDALPDAVKGSMGSTDELPSPDELPDEAIEDDSAESTDEDSLKNGSDDSELDDATLDIDFEDADDEKPADEETKKETNNDSEKKTEDENLKESLSKDDSVFIKDYIIKKMKQDDHETYADKIKDFEITVTAGSNAIPDLENKKIKLGKELLGKDVRDTNNLDTAVIRIAQNMNKNSGQELSESVLPFFGDEIDGSPEQLMQEFRDVYADDSDFAGVEELHERTINKVISNYLTEVYSNVKNFNLTNCKISENNKNTLIVEGIIKFNSGKEKSTKFEFKRSGRRMIEGYNKDFSNEKAFKISIANEDGGKMLLAESLNYNYKIGNTKVSGTVKAK